MYDLNAARTEMRDLFCSIYPDRSLDGFEKAISGFPNGVDTPKQQESWILEMTKMSILAENKLKPADQELVQKSVTKIDEMIINLSKPLSDEEFINPAREKYGYRGASGAKEMLESFDAQFFDLYPEDSAVIIQGMKEAFFDSEEEAREKDTPKKYRKK